MATRFKGGYLTIYTADRDRILGELADTTWTEEHVDGGINHIFTGVASDGTYDEFLRLNAAGIDHVSFDYEADDGVYSGLATLLRPSNDGTPGGTLLTIEALEEPVIRDTNPSAA